MSAQTTRISPLSGLLLALFVLCLTVLGAACGPKYPACEEDADCKAGEFCVNDMCQQCRSNDDCAAGQQCNAGACEDISGYCDDAKPCPGGQECQNNRCATPPPPAEVPMTKQEDGPCQLETVYFAFDSSTLESSARDGIAKNAQCIRTRSLSGVKVTGYTDPRGTEEYNLALGDRRARSVEQYMTSLGVDGKGMSTASMGEEMSHGEDESGWARDRRVEFTSK